MPPRSTRSQLGTVGENLTEPKLNALCASCRHIPFEDIFQSTAGEKAVSYSLGRLDIVKERRGSCRFCQFLTSIYEHIFSPYLKNVGKAPLSQNLLYLVSNDPEKPWFDVAGTEAPDLPQVPTAWLQIRQQEEEETEALSEPYVCISRLPDTPNNSDAAPTKLQYALPRMRQLNEALRGTVDYRLVQEWLNICQRTHTEHCRSRSVSFKRQFLDMKLIDVQNGRIVPDFKSDPYVALSYVWGPDHASKSETRKANGRKRPHESSATNSLFTQLPEHVPKTIRDAMEVVEQIGFKYLWVDWYCVDQSDYEAKQAQIENMHLVYECAYLTIIALDAQNMEEGLAGLSRPLQYTFQPEVAVPSGRYLATFVDSMWDEQGNSPWDLRAWTLQEALLSRRCLFI
jgi:Heterokaryon incompatibility protein (HET)